jgi:hypothetical protein
MQTLCSELTNLERHFPDIDVRTLTIPMKNNFNAPVSSCVAVKKVLPAIPQYLQSHYWWAYVHPRAVHVFERQWLVNLILWGNYKRLLQCGAA